MLLNTYTAYVKGILGLGGGGKHGSKCYRLTNINHFAKHTVFLSLYKASTVQISFMRGSAIIYLEFSHVYN